MPWGDPPPCPICGRWHYPHCSGCGMEGTPLSYEAMAVRCARAEIERDQARAEAARLGETLATAYSNDPEEILDKCRLVGIPLRDFKHIFEIVAEWTRAGGVQEWIEERKRRVP